jgi:hypothetical protein
VDVAGKQLDAHEGSIVYTDGTYWMIGNTYGCGYEWIHKATPWCGFRTYSSPDMVHWTNRGATFDANDAYWQKLCSGLGCFDARLIHDPTGPWRMWFNAYNARSGYAVMSAPSPAGPWTRNSTPNLAVGNNHPGRGNGAGGLFLDRDGKGYIAYTAWTMQGYDVIEQLDPHLLTGTGRHAIIKAPSAEAPSLFRQPGGTYTVTYDDPGCAWCGGVATSYATAPSPMGPWTLRGQLTARSCDGQASAQVAVLPGVILWVSDQWTNLLKPRPAKWNGMTDIRAVGHWNQTNATQHWEPLEFTGPDGRIRPIRCDATITVPLAQR